MSGPKIVLIAPFEYEYGTEEHIARDAEQVGCDVRRIPETACVTSPIINADLVLYMKGHGLPWQATEWWRNIERHGTKTASVHLDLYRGLPREEQVGVDPFWTTSTVFTADGGSQRFFADRGVNHHWLPAACVSDECVTGQYRTEYAADVAFIGKVDGYHTQWPWRQEMVRGLRERYGRRFRCWTHADLVRGEKFRDVVASTKIVVGDTLALPGHANYWSDRIYLTLGTGGFLLFPNVPGLDSQFPHGVGYVPYTPGDLDGLCDLIDDWLNRPNTRDLIAGAGQNIVRSRHTYQHRVRHLLSVLDIPLPDETKVAL